MGEINSTLAPQPSEIAFRCTSAIGAAGAFPSSVAVTRAGVYPAALTWSERNCGPKAKAVSGEK